MCHIHSEVGTETQDSFCWGDSSCAMVNDPSQCSAQCTPVLHHSLDGLRRWPMEHPPPQHEGDEGGGEGATLTCPELPASRDLQVCHRPNAVQQQKLCAYFLVRNRWKSSNLLVCCSQGVGHAIPQP